MQNTFTFKTLVLLSAIISSAAFAQTYNGGMADDGQVHLPPTYTTFTPPAKGQSYNDPAYGTTVTRLTNGKVDFNDNLHHEYGTMNAFNADETRIAIIGDNTGWMIIDLQGNVTDANPPGRGPRWSPTDPDIYYYYNYNDNVLRKYNISTKKSSVVHTFSQYGFITWGGGEDDISADGDHLMIFGDTTHIGVYTISTDAYGTTLNASAQGGFDWADLTATNMVVIRWEKSGAGNYKGYCLYDQNMNFVRKLTTWGAHADRGVDKDGNDVVYAGAYSDTQQPANCNGNNGIEKITNSNANRTCIIDFDWYMELHMSSNSNNGWCLIDLMDLGRVTNGTASETLPNNWQSLWQVYDNELVLIKSDGTKRRICHNYSRAYANCYWCQPRASLSRGGHYALFDSNFGNTQGLGVDYTDVYLVDLGYTTPTAIEEKNMPVSTTVYPNPSTGVFWIEAQTNAKHATIVISVINALGQTIKIFNSNSSFHTMVNMNDQPKGLYFIRTENYGNVTTQRIILD